jgi:hypothetical protein
MLLEKEGTSYIKKRFILKVPQCSGSNMETWTQVYLTEPVCTLKQDAQK